MQKILADAYHTVPKPVRTMVEPLAGLYVSSKEFVLMQKRVRELSLVLNSRIHQYPGRGIFVDLGFNRGVALTAFYQTLSQRFDFHGIEVNKKRFEEAAHTLKRRYPRIMSLEFGAVSTHNGSVHYYENGPAWGCFPYISTTVDSKFGRPSRKTNPRPTQAIDFPVWLESLIADYHTQCDQNPYLAIKMDIEGSEFNVLEALIQQGLHRHISDLVIEFHGGRFADKVFQAELVERRDRIVDTLAKDDVGIHPWI